MDTKIVNAINKVIQDYKDKTYSDEELVLIPAVVCKSDNGRISTITSLAKDVMDNYNNNMLTPNNASYTVKILMEYIARVGLNTGVEATFNGDEFKEIIRNLDGEESVTLLGNSEISMNTTDGEVKGNCTEISREGLALIIDGKTIIKIVGDNIYTASKSGINITGIENGRFKDSVDILIPLNKSGVKELDNFISSYNIIF